MRYAGCCTVCDGGVESQVVLEPTDCGLGVFEQLVIGDRVVEHRDTSRCATERASPSRVTNHEGRRWAGRLQESGSSFRAGTKFSIGKLSCNLDQLPFELPTRLFLVPREAEGRSERAEPDRSRSESVAQRLVVRNSTARMLAIRSRSGPLVFLRKALAEQFGDR